MSFLARVERRLYLAIKRARLKNKTFTLIAENCNGGIISHDLGLKFNTPTINSGFSPDDYLKFLSNLDYYTSFEPIENEVNEDPVYQYGKLGDIEIVFGHYGSFEAGKRKWMERVDRINKDNIYIIMSERNGCTYEHLKKFDALPYKHKCAFTHKPYPDIKCAKYIPGFEEDNEVGVLLDFRPGFFRRRYLDSFDYVSFFNQK